MVEITTTNKDFQSITDASRYFLQHHIEGQRNAEKNKDMPVCANCAHYVKSGCWSGEGKCGKNVPDEILDVKAYHTCDDFEKGEPGQEILMVCGECDHYHHNPDLPEKGCCIFSGRQSAEATHPLDPMNPAHNCDEFSHDGKTFRQEGLESHEDA